MHVALLEPCSAPIFPHVLPTQLATLCGSCGFAALLILLRAVYDKDFPMASSMSTPTAAFMVGAGSMKSVPTPLLVAYSVFLAAAFALYHLVMSDALSAVLTVADMLQCLGVGLLCAQVLSSGSVTGVSARAVLVHAIGICCRLSSTMWLQGYLPVDESGDWFYQAVDITALLMELWLLREVLVVRKDSYQEEADTFPLAPLLLGAFVTAALFHADMNQRPIFDTLWMSGLFLSTVAVLPQLWLINHTGGRVEALTSHHIAIMALATMLSGLFMFYAREDITCKPWVENLNHAVLAILGAHLLHLLLLGDFAYFYLKAVATQGLACRLNLDGAFAEYV
eukprot:TRINITY_DN165_c0_g1_i1.p1 TRINITY_DN165_c0_g1~~TRINITY_DN165_c0_g1_i1.p1  ORF type:complete len:338 (+),score=73.41 TRINITY_DN165_c0_g1_i1:22-1035(+)